MTVNQMAYDVITLGETMLRFSPPDLQRIEQATQFEIHVGGSESNIAVGLARLGLRVAWLSRLTDNPMGHLIASMLRGQNVDISNVVWTNEDRVGLYFLEEGKAPRGSQVWYDRKYSAMSRMTPDDLPRELFEIGTARVLHISGITPALSESAAETVLKAAQLAKSAHWLVSFDVNYRAALWSPAAAAAGCEPLIQLADILYTPLRDAETIFGMPDQPESAVRGLQKRFPGKIVIVTLGADGAIGALPGGELIHQPGYPAEQVGRLGSGDAFVAGSLFGYLQFGELATALQWGNAAAAYKYSITGDIPFFSRAEVESVMKSGGKRGLQR